MRLPRTTIAISQWSVRTCLIGLVLACLLPAVIGTTFLFIHSYREGRAQLEKDTIQTARAVVQLVDSHLFKVQAVAQSLSTSDSLAKNDLATFHRRAQEVVALTGLGANIVLRDKNGQQVLNTFIQFGSPLPRETVPNKVRGVFATGKPAISEVFISAVLKRPIMSIDVPVIIDDKVRYVLSFGILPEYFNAILKMQNLPSEWVAGVLDSAGNRIGQTHVAKQFVGRKASAQLLHAIKEWAEGVLDITTEEGLPVLLFYSRSRLTNWTVGIGIPRQALLAPLIRNLAMLAAGTLALFAISLILAWFISGKIAYSVKALTAPAIALGNGDPVPVPKVYIKEAAAVTLAIGRVADLLKERAATIQATQAELSEAHRLAKFGTWYWNLVTGEVSSSESVAYVYGRTVPSFPEMRGTLLPVESWEKVRAASQEVMQTGKGYNLELQVNHGSGHSIWINSICESIRNDNSEVVALRGTIQDITERKRADERLRESEETLQKFKFFSDYANDVHILIDQQGGIQYVNNLAGECLGYSKAELLHLNISHIYTSHANERFQEIFVRSKQVWIAPFEGMHRRRDGSTFPIEITATLLDFKGEWLMFATSRDITERKLSEQHIREAALHDALTGLPNRALVFEYCSRMLAAAQRSHGQGALLFIDLNRFKPINDLYGHETGDRLLQEVGKRLVDCTRHEDLVGRLGGDEFVIVLPHIDSDRPRAAIVAQHVIQSISQPFRIGTLELSISPAIGISSFPGHASDVGTLIHTADLAMYQAKQSGRADYQFYTPELDQRAQQAHSIEATLNRALKHGGLQLHYQPVIDIISGKVVSAEALVRLTNNDGEEIGPARFIPIAESAGLIGELGEWVATEACRQHKLWLEQGLRITIAINVSPLQFRQRSFATTLYSVIARTGIDPTCLEIEVTESAVMENVDDAIAILKKIKSLGVRVALDDFGTGYSSLSSLSTLPLDKLKVDQSFVRSIERDQASRTVTEAIIALGRSLKLDVVGEGIESADALRFLREHGCNQAQGFWFGRPLPPVQFAHWYRQHRAEVG